MSAIAETTPLLPREAYRQMSAGRERVRQSGGAGTEIVSALIFFEAPQWRAPRARG